MNNQKKPLVVYFHRYPPEYERVQYAGMQDLINELLKEYRVIYFSMKGKQPKDKKLRKKIQVEEIPLRIDTSNGKDKWIKTILYYLFLPKTLSRLKKLKPDFIICKETLPFIPSLVGQLKFPMIVDISDWWWSILLGNKKWGKKFAKKIEQIEVKQWNKLKLTAIAHSKAEANLVMKKGISKSKVKIVNAPLNEKVYFPTEAREERKIIDPNNNSWILATHGVIHPNKGYDQILEWWEKLIKIYPGWKLLIIGGAGGEEWCKKYIVQLNLKNNVIMTGWLPTQEQVNKYLNASDCLLATRRNTPENQGIIASALYHNLMVGKPTLATGLPGPSEIITHNKDGFLFEPDSYESFKSVLEYIYLNPEKAARVAKQGIIRAQECFNPKIAVNKYVAVIDRAISSGFTASHYK